MAAGSKNGAYYAYAKQYAAYLASEGFEVEILETAGSMDNLGRITAEESPVQVAFIQGGIADAVDFPTLKSLGSLYFEPLWVFYERGFPLETLTDFKGDSVAIGPEGSGANFVAQSLLWKNEVHEKNATLLEIPYSESIPKLINKEITAVFLISGAESKNIESLSKASEDLELFSFTRAKAYARSHRYLTQLELPRGSINLATDFPDRDISLLAPTANLVVREDLHPDIAYLFLAGAKKIHFKGDLFASEGQFPNGKALLFPLTEEAAKFYKSGPSLLRRYLPYRVAATLERLRVLIIPLLTLLLPLFKLTPIAYKWGIRRRIFKWYKHLKVMDVRSKEVRTKEEARELLDELEALDRKVLETSVPVGYMDFSYSLRVHVKLIQDHLEKIISDGGAIAAKTTDIHDEQK